MDANAHDPRCGHKRGKGRPPAGWVRVGTDPAVWFCSWWCVILEAEDHLGGTIEEMTAEWLTVVA